MAFLTYHAHTYCLAMDTCGFLLIMKPTLGLQKVYLADNDADNWLDKKAMKAVAK